MAVARAIEGFGAALPEVPAVASFDTALHADMPVAASTHAIRPEWRKRWDLRRHGVHGLSHAFATRRAAAMLGHPLDGVRLVTCHLCAGASLAGVREGRSPDTTTGYTPLDGLVMATRSGSIDPRLVLWLAEHARMPPAELAATLGHRSGLLGLAGTADMRAILAAADAGEPDAVLALDVLHHRLRAAVAAMAAALGGLDVLVFTGGVGENAPAVRERAVRDLALLGVEVDQGAAGRAAMIARSGQRAPRSARSSVAAREDVQIAHEVRQVLGLPAT